MADIVKMFLKKLPLALAIHVSLYVYALLYSALAGSAAGFLEPLTWPLFTLGALIASIVLAFVIPPVEAMLKRYLP